MWMRVEGSESPARPRTPPGDERQRRIRKIACRLGNMGAPLVRTRKKELLGEKDTERGESHCSRGLLILYTRKAWQSG